MIINFDLIAEPNCGVAVDSSSTQYAPDAGMTQYTKGEFTKTGSVVLNILRKDGSEKASIKIQDDNIIDCEVIDHKDPTEVTHHKFTQGDGLYTIDHFIVPTVDWYNYIYSSGSFESTYEIVICFDPESKSLYQVDSEGNSSAISPQQLLSMYNDNLDISVAHSQSITLCTCGLHECYFHIAMQLLQSAGPCSTQDSADLVYKRDMVWMGINVINYLLDLGDPYTAALVLKKLEECNGVCSKWLQHKPFKDCGCGK